MVRVYTFIRRNSLLTHDQCVHYFKNVHSQLCKDLLPGMRSYSGNFPVGMKADPGFKHADFDILVDQRFDSLEAMRAALDGPAFAMPERVASSKHLIDFNRTELFVADEFKVVG